MVFDGDRGGGSTGGGEGVRVIFSSARERADQVLARMASRGVAVVSNDREVRQAASRAGATAITADQFLDRLRQPPSGPVSEKDEDHDTPPRQKKGNPRRLPKKARAAARALNRLGR